VDDVAFFLDVSPAEYVALEEGRKRFSAVKLLLLSEFLAVNVAMFFGEATNSTPKTIRF
jgi:transcriptional regulator with XRE-family HTH domain